MGVQYYPRDTHVSPSIEQVPPRQNGFIDFFKFIVRVDEVLSEKGLSLVTRPAPARIGFPRNTRSYSHIFLQSIHPGSWAFTLAFHGSATSPRAHPDGPYKQRYRYGKFVKSRFHEPRTVGHESKVRLPKAQSHTFTLRGFEKKTAASLTKRSAKRGK